MDKEIQITVKTKYCDVCGEDLRLYDGFPFVSANDKDYCPECAYKTGVITKKEWGGFHGIHSDECLKHIEVI